MKKNKISALAKQYGVVLGFVLLICIGALLSKTCLSAQNLINILKQYAPIVVISCGTTLVIISGPRRRLRGCPVGLYFRLYIPAYALAGSGDPCGALRRRPDGPDQRLCYHAL